MAPTPPNDTFAVHYDLRGSQLTLVLQTDLGDQTILMVSVSRSYQKRGSNELLLEEYFSERSTVGSWREPHTITLDQDAWNREVQRTQQGLAAAGQPFTVGRIADHIDISFVVPVNQGPPFEDLNANLTGKTVTQDGNLRLVERDIAVNHPIGATNVGKTRFADPLNLTSGTTYRASGEVPVVTSIEPADPVAAAAAIRQLNPGEEFTVLERSVRRRTPWYHVRTRSGEGWLNSIALIGQNIVVVK